MLLVDFALAPEPSERFQRSSNPPADELVLAWPPDVVEENEGVVDPAGRCTLEKLEDVGENVFPRGDVGESIPVGLDMPIFMPMPIVLAGLA